MWLREVLNEQVLMKASQSIGTHSAKATALSWMCKAHAPGDIQRLAGYHVDPSTKSALEYSRDSQAPVLHFMEGMILAIFAKLFMPDFTRAGRWVGCRSLEQALEILSKRSSDEPIEKEWGKLDEEEEEQPSLFGSLGRQENFESEAFLPADQDAEQLEESDDERAAFELQSSASEEHSGDDHEEDDQQLEIAGKAISGLVSSAGAHDARVFRHRVSGIYHLMAGESNVPDVDGDMSSTKCGKLITHNFEELDSCESFLPTKCKRCFTF